MHSEAGLAVPRPGRVLRLLWRALRLRCPNCGRGRIPAGWFRMRSRCPACGLRTERGERDYYLGSMLFNLIVAEAIFVAALVGVLFLSWPAVPWDLLEIAAPLLMVAAPIALFPWSKVLWLAFDLAFRPLTDEELAWHREAVEGSN